MREKNMDNIRPFEAIPFVEPTDEMSYNPARVMIERYERHGPIFRTKTAGGPNIVYMIGPEANRFVLASGRHKFSHRMGWGQLFRVLVTYGDGVLTMDGAIPD